MELMVKRVLLALCFVLIVATAGWCIDPFKANKGGFGPKIKGLQLGMRLDGARVGASGGILNSEEYGAQIIELKKLVSCRTISELKEWPPKSSFRRL